MGFFGRRRPPVAVVPSEARTSRPSGVTPAADEIIKQKPRTLVGRMLRTFVDPWIDYCFYRLDLNGRDGRPVHSKVLSTVAFGFGLIGLAMFGTQVVETCAAVQRLTQLAAKGSIAVQVDTLAPLVKSCALMTTALLAYAGLVFGMPFGLSGFKVWASTKGGGTTEALADVAKAEAQTQAAIAKRRASAPDGTFEVT